MRVVLAQPRGFCAGVERAIEIVERALEKYGPPIYVRHEIVHNRHVVERLRIRAHRDDDLADLMALAGNWEIARWVGTIPHPYSEADGREWITRVQENHSTGRPPLRNRAEGNRPPDRRCRA